MKEIYLNLMEKTLSAYSNEHILRYFDEVRKNGLTEHGFPRLTANIGILIAHGRRQDLIPLFVEMMTFCCKTIPRVKAANDFSVREIVSCLVEIEDSGILPKDVTHGWRTCLAAIEPTRCYTVFATSPADKVRNWALFTAVSEYFRMAEGMGGSMDFIELQLEQQLQWLDGNGMYRDHADGERWQPIVYDLVPRGLFSILLSRGYRGKFYQPIDQALKKAGMLTLHMQSPNGEVAYGGRSNQFLHNEPWMIAVFEYEAQRYTREGNGELAARFREAIGRALAVTREWLEREPIRHIKNRFPTETKFGCEKYAYFDKYMITVASNLWVAYLIGDGTTQELESEDTAPCVAETSRHFHKLFAKAGGYGLEFDLYADPHYDASGLGRVHRRGAPSTICLSCPCPSEADYRVDVDTCGALSLCSAVYGEGEWHLGAEQGSVYRVLHSQTTEKEASAELVCRFAEGQETRESYTVGEDGVLVRVVGEGRIGYALPVFDFDGETHSRIQVGEHTVCVVYDGWICRYTTDGRVVDRGALAANRNGHYRVFLATGHRELTVKIEISKES